MYAAADDQSIMAQRLIERDHALYVDTQVAHIEDSIDGDDTNKLHQSIAKVKHFQHWKPYAGHSIRDEEGHLLTALGQASKRWKRFFEGVMHGKATTFRELVIEDRRRHDLLRGTLP